MNIPKIIITDTHFGRKNNSMVFLKSQMTFFDALLKKIYSLPKGTRVDLVHAGDLFDSRSTMNVCIIEEVMQLIRRLINAIKHINPDNKMIIISGNHDFYSPVSDSINSIDTIILPIFGKDIISVCRSEMIDPDDPGTIYIPWFRWNEHLDDIDFTGKDLAITHTDLHMNIYDNRVPADMKVYSGHIHSMRKYRNGNMINLPSPYGLDFSDVNDDMKGAFWVDDKRNVSLWLRNDTSIKFRKLVDSHIFDIPDIDKSIDRGDNYNIYLSQEFRENPEVPERINELREDFRYINIIPISSTMDINEGSKPIESLDIENILRYSLGDTLKPKFDEVASRVDSARHNNI